MTLKVGNDYAYGHHYRQEELHHILIFPVNTDSHLSCFPFFVIIWVFTRRSHANPLGVLGSYYVSF